MWKTVLYQVLSSSVVSTEWVVQQLWNILFPVISHLSYGNWRPENTLFLLTYFLWTSWKKNWSSYFFVKNIFLPWISLFCFLPLTRRNLYLLFHTFTDTLLLACRCGEWKYTILQWCLISVLFYAFSLSSNTEILKESLTDFSDKVIKKKVSEFLR